MVYAPGGLHVPKKIFKKRPSRKPRKKLRRAVKAVVWFLPRTLRRWFGW